MAFDEQDRFDHTETDNHVNEQNQTAGTAQNEANGRIRIVQNDKRGFEEFYIIYRYRQKKVNIHPVLHMRTERIQRTQAVLMRPAMITAIIIRHRIAAAMAETAETAAATISIQALRNIIPGRRAVLARRWLRQHVSALSSDWQLQL